MRQQQIAVLAGELLHAQVRLRLAVKCLYFLLLPLGGMPNQLIGSLPGVGFVLAADYLQPHAEADVVFAVMRARHRPDLGDVGGDLFRQVAPEQMHVGMFGRQFPSLARAAAWRRCKETIS